MDLNQDTLYIFTDGSCYPNPGPGGWAALMIYNGWCKFHYGGSDGETNNSMELRAILEGLKARLRSDVNTVLYTDSQYCVNALTKWWKGWEKKGWLTGQGKPVKNQEYIREILHHTENVQFKWMKGHSGNCFNEAADQLARKGRALVEDNPTEDPELSDIFGLMAAFVPPPNEKTPPPFDPNDIKPTVEKVDKPSLTVPANLEGASLRDIIAGLHFATSVKNAYTETSDVHRELIKESYLKADMFLALKDEQ